MGRSFITVLLALSLSPCAWPQNERDASSKLIALERMARMQAIEMKDLKMLSEVLHDHFVAVDQDGRLFNKAEMLQFVETATSLRFRSNDMTVRMHGSTAIITGTYQLQSLVAGKPRVRHGRFIDTWLMHANGKWVAVASISTPLP